MKILKLPLKSIQQPQLVITIFIFFISLKPILKKKSFLNINLRCLGIQYKKLHCFFFKYLYVNFMASLQAPCTTVSSFLIKIPTLKIFVGNVFVKKRHILNVCFKNFLLKNYKLTLKFIVNAKLKTKQKIVKKKLSSPMTLLKIPIR